MPGAAVTAKSGPPIIALNGDNPAAIPVGATYADLGARITAPAADTNLGLTTLVDGATTTQITLDTSKPSTHTILYIITDPKGLTGSATRTVIVKAANDNAASSTPSVATSTVTITPTANDNHATTTCATTTAAASTAQ